MAPNVDQVNLIFNTADITMQNHKMSLSKSLVDALGIFAERVHKVYLVNSDLIYVSSLISRFTF